MMATTWAVTIVYTALGPIDIEPILAAYAGTDITFSQSDDELSFTMAVEAPLATDAQSIADHVFFRATIGMDLPLGVPVEIRVIEWSRFEAELEESNFPDIVSAPEVAEILGVSRQRVHQLINENKSFPPPLVRLGSGPIWLRATIEAFDRSWTRKPGRPRADDSSVQAVIDGAGDGLEETLSMIAARRAAKDADIESRR